MRKYLILGSFLLLAVSCQKENNIIDNGPKIVLNGLIASDSLFGVTISQSSLIIDTAMITNLVSNAKVCVYENDIFVDSLYYSFDGYINTGARVYIPTNYVSRKITPVPGNEYKIRVSVPNLPDITSKVIIPNVVTIDRIDTTRFIDTNSSDTYISNVRFLCNVEFTDPANEKNFYLLFIYRLPEISRYDWNLVFQCEDPIVEEKITRGNCTEGVAFSDKSINGKRYKLSVTISGQDIGKPFRNMNDFTPNHKTRLYFRLYSITEDYFKYIQTLNLFYQNFKNPLAEPTQVYTNITGGYGIFAGAAVSSDSIVFRY